MKLLLSLVLTLLLFSVAVAQSAGPLSWKARWSVARIAGRKQIARPRLTALAQILRKRSSASATATRHLLAVANTEGGFTFYELQLGKYKRSGKNWLEYIGKRIAVTGATGKKKESCFYQS